MTKDAILDAALEMAACHGVDATSMRKIAARVGIAAPSLYAHFGSKDEIFSTLMEREGPESAIALLTTLEAEIGCDRPRALLSAFIDRLVMLWTTDRARAFRRLCGSLDLESSLAAPYREDVQRVIETLAALFERWRQLELCKGQITPATRAWMLMAPLGNLRTTFWELGASNKSVDKGRNLARSHREFFLACHFLSRAR